MDAPPVQYAKTSDGYDIACFVAGTGRTLIRTPVFWNHISRQWHRDLFGPLFNAYAERFRFVLYDGRGQGLSTRGLPPSFSLDDMIRDLEAVVEHTGAERFLLYGMGFAAIVAIRYALEHPERVEGLVLWDYIDFQTRTDAMLRLAEEDWPSFIDYTARFPTPGW